MWQHQGAGLLAAPRGDSSSRISGFARGGACTAYNKKNSLPVDADADAERNGPHYHHQLIAAMLGECQRLSLMARRSHPAWGAMHYPSLMSLQCNVMWVTLAALRMTHTLDGDRRKTFLRPLISTRPAHMLCCMRTRHAASHACWPMVAGTLHGGTAGPGG